MDEAEWLACADPKRMLESLGGQASERKLRLLCSACSRRLWHLLEAHGLRKAVDALELYADNVIDRESFRAAAGETHPIKVYREELLSGDPRAEIFLPAYSINGVIYRLNMQSICRALEFFALATRAARGEPWEDGPQLRPCEVECSAQAALIREVLGNPCRAVPFDPARLRWSGGLLGALARTVYEERSLPEGTLNSVSISILADALEDAGCTDAEILGHLHGPGPHVRGCWALDLILGKE